jgi:hypothetical protein
MPIHKFSVGLQLPQTWDNLNFGLNYLKNLFTCDRPLFIEKILKYSSSHACQDILNCPNPWFD